MKLSIVTTMYYSSDYIYEFYARITDEAKKITQEYEVIFVDDGSPDDSLKKAVDLHKKDNKVKVIELSRNFGHHKAIMTGLKEATGDYIFLIDVDLEEEPELLGKFWEELQKDSDIDVVYGVQESRKGGWFERLSGAIFYSIHNFLSDVKIPRNLVTARLFSKIIQKTLLKYKEKELVLAFIYVDIGFNQKSIIIKKHSLSLSTYSFKKKVYLMINSIVSFTNKPLLLIFYLGFSLLTLSLFYIIFLISQKVFSNKTISGWTSIMVSIYFSTGLVMMSLGVISIYVSKIFLETKNRPYTNIKNRM